LQGLYGTALAVRMWFTEIRVFRSWMTFHKPSEFHTIYLIFGDNYYLFVNPLQRTGIVLVIIKNLLKNKIRKKLG
jgi:hypothetical protein